MLVLNTLKNGSAISRTAVLSLGMLFFASSFIVMAPHVSAQSQYVTATPGNINLGMTTNITVTGPASGSYNVVVVKPSGTLSQMTETFASAGQVQNVFYGNSTSGFKSLVDQVGTYNVFLEQGTTVVSSTSFYATNKLIVSMDMISGSACAYIPAATRGMEMFPRFYITYASTGGPVTNVDKGITVTYTLPDNTKTNATWHAANTISQSSTGFFIGRLLPAWNYTSLGPWVPTVKISDPAGNTVTWTYIGMPFTISAATLSTSITLQDSATNQTVISFSSGQSVNILANVTYPAPPAGAAAVKGFVGPLDSATKGGSVSALVGWGYYNTTTGSFGGKNPGALLSQITMTYNAKSHLWTGVFNATSLPALSTGTTFKVIISAKDKASPPNIGTASLSVSAAPQSSTQSTTQSTTQTTTSSQSTTTTTWGIPVWAYAATTITLVMGVIIGFIARKK